MTLIKYSTNKVSWITATINLVPALTNSYISSLLDDSIIIDIQYANNIWAAATNNGVLLKSSQAYNDPLGTFYTIYNNDEGTIWVNQTSNTTSIINCIAYGNGIWIAAGASAQLRRSTNGITWTTQTSNFDSANPFNNILAAAYGNGLWVIGGNYGRIRTSTDAVTWVTVPLPIGQEVFDIAYANNIWVAVGDAGEIRTSTNAINWTTRTSNFGIDAINAISYGNGIWIAAGTSGKINRSTDTITWTTQTSNFGNTNIFSVAYSNGVWAAAGYSGQIRVSTNGIAWATRTSNFGSSQIKEVFANNGIFMAVGYSGQLRTSTDTVTWVTQNSGFGNKTINTITYGNGMWFAGGYDGQLKNSQNSLKFNSISQLNKINNQFIVISNNSVRVSDDLVTWTTLLNFGNLSANRFVESNGKHILVSNSGMLYHKNTSSLTWTTISTGINDNFTNVAQRNGIYDVIGQNAVYSSSDLITWVTVQNLSASIINGIIALP